MDERLDEEARTCAVIARSYGLIPYSLSTLWEMIQPFCPGMESNGRSLNCWHHTDYGQQYRLHHFWDKLIKALAYLALANSWGELNGRPRPPTIPPPASSASAFSPYLSDKAYEQATQAAAAPAAMAKEMIKLAKEEE